MSTRAQARRARLEQERTTRAGRSAVLGLMLVVTNALMLLLTSKIADWLDIGFHVEGFWTAVGASIVISLTSIVIDAVLPD